MRFGCNHHNLGDNKTQWSGMLKHTTELSIVRFVDVIRVNEDVLRHAFICSNLKSENARMIIIWGLNKSKIRFKWVTHSYYLSWVVFSHLRLVKGSVVGGVYSLRAADFPELREATDKLTRRGSSRGSYHEYLSISYSCEYNSQMIRARLDLVLWDWDVNSCRNSEAWTWNSTLNGAKKTRLDATNFRSFLLDLWLGLPWLDSNLGLCGTLTGNIPAANIRNLRIAVITLACVCYSQVFSVSTTLDFSFCEELIQMPAECPPADRQEQCSIPGRVKPTTL